MIQQNLFQTVSFPLRHRAGLRFTELGRSCSQILVNPTALFLSYLTVIKLVDLGFSSVMIFPYRVLIYLDHRIVLVLNTTLTTQDVCWCWQDVYLSTALLQSLITPNSSEMIMPCHTAIYRHKFYLIIKPQTHLVHLVIELCINFVYSIKN